MTGAAPPRWPLAVVETLGPAPFAEAVAGDLLEEFAERSPRGLGSARLWLALQAARSVAPLLALRLRRASPRVATTSCALGLLSGACAVAGARALWGYVLFLVPLRAGHPPSPGWVAAAVAGTLACAAWGAFAGAVVARRIFEGESS